EPSRQYVGIAHVDRGLARHDSVHTLNRSYGQPCDHFRRVTDQVWRQDCVAFRQQAQGVVTRWRFDGEYIDRDAADVATPGEFVQLGFVGDTAARDIDEDRARLHQAQPLCVEHPPGLLVQRAQYDDHIAGVHQLVKFDSRYAGWKRRSQPRRVGLDANVPSLESPRDRLSDLPEPNQTDELVLRHLRAHRIWMR